MPLHDYFYRFPDSHLGTPGRCRVRMYKNLRGNHVVLLTELGTNSGESISAACDRIATGLTARWGLNPKTTRWIEHAPPLDDAAAEFDELKFTWKSDKTAENPQWTHLDSQEAEAMTGEDLNALNRSLGDNLVVSRSVDNEKEARQAEPSLAD